MILQALVEHYESLVGQGKLSGPGWSDTKVSYALCINAAGELEQVSTTKIQPPDGKSNKLVPQPMCLPSPVKRSSGISSNFLWDSSGYILGLDNKGKPERSIDCFNACKALHHQLLDRVDSPAAKALLAFFDHWDPSQTQSHPALQEYMEDIISVANLVFRYNGEYVHNDPLIRQAWQEYYNSSSDETRMVCLVTGRKSAVELVHPAIKGLVGAQSSGAALVSFNAPAFCSYGKEQNQNAPVSKYAAFAYTSALNYMLADRQHIIREGDTTVLFWAKDGGEAYQQYSYSALYSPNDIFGTVKSLIAGNSVEYDETMLDPNMDFYILGIAPNAARMSVQFFLRNSFGGFLKNVYAHHERMNIVRPTADKFESIPLWKMLSATVNQKSKDKSPSKVMTGETLRAVLTDTIYPASLLNGVTLRIRADCQVDRTRAAIIKAYYLKNPNPQVPKEVLTVSLNTKCDDTAYVLGRLFSVYEAVQSAANPGINTTIKDKYFNSAASTPATVFSILGNLSQKHLKKLKGNNMGLAVYYEKQIGEIADLLSAELPTCMSLPQQGSFQLGYYHQTQARYQKKEEQENV